MKNAKLNLTDEFKAKVAAFVALLEADQLRGHLQIHFRGRALDQLDSDQQAMVKGWSKVSVHYGAAWVRVDVGTSGKYMVDAAGNIFGIKAYGVPHRGHWFGTLDTVHDLDWSGYRGDRKAVELSPALKSAYAAAFESQPSWKAS